MLGNSEVSIFPPCPQMTWLSSPSRRLQLRKPVLPHRSRRYCVCGGTGQESRLSFGWAYPLPISNTRMSYDVLQPFLSVDSRNRQSPSWYFAEQHCRRWQIVYRRIVQGFRRLTDLGPLPLEELPTLVERSDVCRCDLHQASRSRSSSLPFMKSFSDFFTLLMKWCPWVDFSHHSVCE